MISRNQRGTISISMLLLVAACSSGGTEVVTGGTGGQLRVVNGSQAVAAVQVFVDGAPVSSSSFATGVISSVFAVDSGEHLVEFRPVGGGAGNAQMAEFAPNKLVLAVAVDSGGRLTPAIMADTNSIVPAGATKVRVANLAQNAGRIDIWRTQPDFGTPIRVEFPFLYGTISPYLQSTPGNWNVLVSDTVATNAGPNPGMPDTLGASDAFSVPEGALRTVLVVDKPGGGVKFVVVNP
ncbi:MAG TPA: DUF4397 domain-containing protein [Gemmatimonadales bacterium]